MLRTYQHGQPSDCPHQRLCSRHLACCSYSTGWCSLVEDEKRLRSGDAEAYALAMARPAEKKWPWRKLRSEAEPVVTEAAKVQYSQVGARVDGAHKPAQTRTSDCRFMTQGADTGSAEPVRDSERIRRKWDEAGRRCVLGGEEGKERRWSEPGDQTSGLLQKESCCADRSSLPISRISFFPWSLFAFSSRLSHCASLVLTPVSAGRPLVLLCLIQSCAPTGQWGRNAAA